MLTVPVAQFSGSRSPALADMIATIARDLQGESDLIQAAMDVLATRQIFSAGPCGCGKGGLSYGWPVGPKS